MKRFAMLLVLSSLGWALVAQAQAPAEEAPVWDAKSFIIKNHVHEISGITTLTLATITGAAGATIASGATWLSPKVHGALAYSTIGAGAITLALGLTAFSNRLDTVWPHVLFMGLAETGMLVNAFVLKPGSLPHEINGAVSITSLYLGLASILLIKNSEKNPM